MCYPYPGPRCSRHTQEHLVAARTRFDEVAKNFDEESIEYLTAKALLSSAASAYRSSPAGIRQLEQDLADLPENSLAKDKALIEKALTRAKAKREIHKNAYREVGS